MVEKVIKIGGKEFSPEEVQKLIDSGMIGSGAKYAFPYVYEHLNDDDVSETLVNAMHHVSRYDRFVSGPFGVINTKDSQFTLKKLKSLCREFNSPWSHHLVLVKPLSGFFYFIKCANVLVSNSNNLQFNIFKNILNDIIKENKRI
jgi:hypothetical protein